MMREDNLTNVMIFAAVGGCALALIADVCKGAGREAINATRLSGGEWSIRMHLPFAGESAEPVAVAAFLEGSSSRDAFACVLIPDEALEGDRIMTFGFSLVVAPGDCEVAEFKATRRVVFEDGEAVCKGRDNRNRSVMSGSVALACEPVPEPQTWLGVLCGAVALLAASRWRHGGMG